MNTKTPCSPPTFDQLLLHARHCSRYLAHLLDAEPELLAWLHENYLIPCDGKVMQIWSDALPADGEEALSRALRNLRKRVMLHVLTRDLNGLSGLDEVMRSMTALAELAVRRAQAVRCKPWLSNSDNPLVRRAAPSGTAGDRHGQTGRGRIECFLRHRSDLRLSRGRRNERPAQSPRGGRRGVPNGFAITLAQAEQP